MCISWKQLLWCEFYESTRGTSFQQGSQQAKVKCDNNIRKFSEKYSAKYLFFKREITKHFALSWKPCLSLRSGQIPDREPPCNVNISDSLFFHPFPCTCTIPFMSKYWICLPSLNHYTSGGDLGYQCVSVAAQRLSWGVVKAVDAAWSVMIVMMMVMVMVMVIMAMMVIVMMTMAMVIIGDDGDNDVSSPSTTEDELKPAVHKRKIAFATKSASSLHSSSLRGLRNNWIITIIIIILSNYQSQSVPGNLLKPDSIEIGSLKIPAQTPVSYMEHISIFPFYASVCISVPSILDFPPIFIWNIFLQFHFGPLCVFLCPLYWIFHIFLPSGAGCVAWHCWGCWPALLLEQSFRKTTFLRVFYDFF